MRPMGLEPSREMEGADFFYQLMVAKAIRPHRLWLPMEEVAPPHKGGWQLVGPVREEQRSATGHQYT